MPNQASSTRQERDRRAFLVKRLGEVGSHALAQNDLLAFPKARDNLSTVITDQAGLEPDLLLVSGGINDGHCALITALADG